MALPPPGVLDTFHESTDYFHELDLMAGGVAAGSRKEAHHERERQIMVDPSSLRDPPSTTFNRRMAASAMPPPSPHSVRPRTVSHSLPSSASSSPRFSFQVLRKKKSKKPQCNAYPHRIDSIGGFSVQQQARLRRSKSCGEKRWCAPADEIDLLFGQPTYSTDSQSPKLSPRLPSIKNDGNHENTKEDDEEEKFKCGVLCLHLSRFGKSKPVNSCRKEIAEVEAEIGSIISRTVSLERFECGSWASSAIIADLTDQDGEERKSLNLFFDLPLELIRIGLNDTTTPVSSAFLFDDKDINVGGKFHDQFSSPSPQFGFTASSPAATLSSTYKLNPRLRHSRDDFDALLQAHNT